jgi:hypothetical protein
VAGDAGRFRLADGETVRLDGDEVRAVYEELWGLVGEAGAVTTAALVIHALRAAGTAPVELDERQSAVFRLARSRLAHPA